MVLCGAPAHVTASIESMGLTSFGSPPISLAFFATLPCLWTTSADGFPSCWRHSHLLRRGNGTEAIHSAPQSQPHPHIVLHMILILLDLRFYLLLYRHEIPGRYPSRCQRPLHGRRRKLRGLEGVGNPLGSIIYFSESNKTRKTNTKRRLVTAEMKKKGCRCVWSHLSGLLCYILLLSIFSRYHYSVYRCPGYSWVLSRSLSLCVCVSACFGDERSSLIFTVPRYGRSCLRRFSISTAMD